MVSTADILERAANRISKPGAWIQGASARTAFGWITKPDDPNARCWCASGAICAEAEDHEQNQAVHKFLTRLLRQKVWGWNDRKRRTQEEVVAKLKEAAAKAREVSQ